MYAGQLQARNDGFSSRTVHRGIPNCGMSMSLKTFSPCLAGFLLPTRISHERFSW